MSIEREGDTYTPACDICGTTLPEEFDFADAVEAKKAAGWRSKQDELGWHDICPDCYAEQNGAAADFSEV